MSGSDRGGRVTTFLRFVDPGAYNLLDKVDFRGLIGTALNSFLLLLFLALVGLLQSAQRGFSVIVESFGDMISLITLAPTLTLANLQRQAVEIASREVLDFGLFALPVSVFFALAALGVVVVGVNVLWRP